MQAIYRDTSESHPSHEIPTMTKTIYVVDVKSGNLQLLANAIDHVLPGSEVVFLRSAADFAAADDKIEVLLLPGVGNYGHFVKQLTDRELNEPLKRYIALGRRIMGICVGLQVLMNYLEESPGREGLGLLELSLSKFTTEDPLFVERGVRKAVPEIGWNQVLEFTNGPFYTLGNDSKYYFVHLYAAITNNQQDAVAKAQQAGWKFAYTTYGSEQFVAAAVKDNVFATQFHPEKSGKAGLALIKLFLENNIDAQPLQGPPAPADTEKTLTGLSRRVIACLDVRLNDLGDLVVTKGDQYDVREKDEGAAVRNLGKPVELATRYYEQGADEITFLNITLFRNHPLNDQPMLEVLKQAAKTIFVPLTVGGGIKDLEQDGEVIPAAQVAAAYFLAGADKVLIGSDAVAIAEQWWATGKQATGKLSIETISATFGVQAVVILVDPRRKYVALPDETTMATVKAARPGPNGEEYCYYQVTLQGGRRTHELGALELCVACEALGAGEILLNLIDHDGTNAGFNLELLNQVKRAVSIPVIALSGAGNPGHFKEVFDMECGIDAALGAGLFHRGEYTVNDIKGHLREHGMDVRLE